MANGYKHDAKVVYGDTDSVMIKFGTETVISLLFRLLFWCCFAACAAFLCLVFAARPKFVDGRQNDGRRHADTTDVSVCRLSLRHAHARYVALLMIAMESLLVCGRLASLLRCGW